METWSSGSVALEWRKNPAGAVVLAPQPVHRIHVHASPPVPASCRATGYRYTRRRGDIDITPAGAEGGHDAARSATSLELRIPTAFVQRVAEDMGLDASRAGLEVRHLVRDPGVAHLAWALEAEHRAGYPGGALYLDSLATSLAVWLLGRHAAREDAPSRLPRRDLLRVLDHIEAHLDQPLSLRRLASVAGISSSLLRSRFKSAMGSPVHQYVVRRRVERARVLLLRRELPAGEVALAAGFAHQSHMARWMRRVLGTTPTVLLASKRA